MPDAAARSRPRRPSAPWLALAALACAGPVRAQTDVHAQVEVAARRWLSAEVARQGITPLRLEVDVVDPVRRPGDCAQPWQVETLKGRMDRLQLVATCPGNGEQARYVARTRIIARVVVARADLLPGQPIAADALVLSEQDIADADDALTDPAQAIGRSSRRALRAGKPLRAQYLHADNGVRRGQPVQIVGGQPGFRISIGGTAMGDAGIGQPVRVRNGSTGRIVTAIVSDEGTVSVAAPR